MEQIENTGASPKKSHKLIVDARKSLSIFGLTEVIETTPSYLSVRLPGEILHIKGSNISIKKLEVEEGSLEASGVVHEIKYQGHGPKTPLLKKIFK